MNPQEKIDSVVKGVEAGDAKGVQQVLNTITDGVDQNIYMQQFASRLNDSRTCSSLPGCQISDLDKDGSPESIKAGHITIAKINTAEGQRLQATSDVGPNWAERTKERVVKTVDDVRTGVSDWWSSTGLGNALNRAGTNDSELNRRWNRQMTDAERPPEAKK